MRRLSAHGIQLISLVLSLNHAATVKAQMAALIPQCRRLRVRLGLRCKSRREAEGVLESTRVGDALSGDVKGGAVRGRCKRDGQADEHGDAIAEAKELGRDLSLVVIHHHHAIKFAPLRSQEDRVRGDGPADMNAVDWSRSTVGPMIRISSSPNSPCSPA